MVCFVNGDHILRLVTRIHTVQISSVSNTSWGIIARMLAATLISFVLSSTVPIHASSETTAAENVSGPDPREAKTTPQGQQGLHDHIGKRDQEGQASSF